MRKTDKQVDERLTDREMRRGCGVCSLPGNVLVSPQEAVELTDVNCRWIGEGKKNFLRDVVT